jgi:hypothetical protein
MRSDLCQCDREAVKYLRDPEAVSQQIIVPQNGEAGWKGDLCEFCESATSATTVYF